MLTFTNSVITDPHCRVPFVPVLLCSEYYLFGNKAWSGESTAEMSGFLVPALASHQLLTVCQVFSHRPEYNKDKNSRIHPNSLHRETLTSFDV